jgi:hypothetical protein
MKSKKPYNCGIGPAFEVIGGKWKAVILWELHVQPRRFGELRRLLPDISEKMLIQQLRELEADGIVQPRGVPRSAAASRLLRDETGRNAQCGARPAGRLGRPLRQARGNRAQAGRGIEVTMQTERIECRC